MIRCSAALIPKLILRALFGTSANESRRQRTTPATSDRSRRHALGRSQSSFATTLQIAGFEISRSGL
jgi:hypothetical protein